MAQAESNRRYPRRVGYSRYVPVRRSIVGLLVPGESVIHPRVVDSLISLAILLLPVSTSMGLPTDHPVEAGRRRRVLIDFTMSRARCISVCQPGPDAVEPPARSVCSDKELPTSATAGADPA